MLEVETVHPQIKFSSSGPQSPARSAEGACLFRPPPARSHSSWDLLAAVSSPRPQPCQSPPPEAHRLVRACEGFQHVPVFLHAATKALLELLVLAPFDDVLVDLRSLLLGGPATTGEETEADERPLRIHQ